MRYIQESKSYTIYFLFFLYSLANIFLLLNYSGLYWDDWVLVNQEPASILNMYSQNGFWWMGYFHLFLQNIGNGIYVYRLITFFSYFLSGLCLYYILQKIPYFTKNAIFFIVLLFLLAPVNDARIALINTPAILTLFIFYLAFFLLAVFMDSNKKLYFRIPILALFLISFCLESLLVFYAIVLCYILFKIYQENQNKRISALIKIFFTQYLDFICLPLIFFALKQSLFQPYGLYAGYNNINIHFKHLVYLIIKSFFTSFTTPIFQALTSIIKNWFIAVFIAAVVLCTIKKIPIFSVQKLNAPKTNKYFFLTVQNIMLFIGAAFFVLAVFPYCAVGKLPQLDNWASRNQILIPLGMAFLIYYLSSLTAVIHKKIPVLLMTILITSFIVQTLHNHHAYNLDWFYQKSLLAQFKQSKLIKNNSTFIADDKLEMDVWVHRRGLSFYEANGLLKKAFNQDSRLLIHDINWLNDMERYKKHSQYNFSHWVKEKPTYIVLSKNSNYTLTTKKQFWLYYNSLFNQPAFEKEIGQLTKITPQVHS